jgi:hypothetical protein
MVKDSVDIESAFRPLNALSKILGLAQFSGYTNSVTGKIIHEENCEWKFKNFVWCVFDMCSIVAGFVYNIITLYFS